MAELEVLTFSIATGHVLNYIKGKQLEYYENYEAISPADCVSPFFFAFILLMSFRLFLSCSTASLSPSWSEVRYY